MGPTGRIQVSPGSTFCPGTIFTNVDLAKWLEEQLNGNHETRQPA